MCDTIVVVRDDAVLFAKNSDRDPNEAQLLEWHVAQRHPPDTRLRCTWMEIPQAERTHAILISRPFWMWGAEMGTNEHGVTIGNEAVFTRQPYAKVGLTGMDLLRLALERASSAREASSVIIELLERHGQGGGCGLERPSFTYHNSFAIADGRSAYVLETAGRRWALEEVHEGARTISNGLTIPHFADRHSDRLRSTVSRCGVRAALTGRLADPRSASPEALMNALRSHGVSAWPSYSPINGAMSSPCMHAGGLIASSQTTASWVSELRPGASTHWATATAAPCVSLFKPVHVNAPADLGPSPTDRYEPETVWWRHERLHRAALRDPAAVGFLSERNELQQRWLSDPPGTAAAFAQATELEDGWAAELGSPGDRRPAWVRRYWRERDRRAGLPAPVPAGTQGNGPSGLRADSAADAVPDPQAKALPGAL